MYTVDQVSISWGSQYSEACKLGSSIVYAKESHPILACSVHAIFHKDILK